MKRRSIIIYVLFSAALAGCTQGGGGTDAAGAGREKYPEVKEDRQVAEPQVTETESIPDEGSTAVDNADPQKPENIETSDVKPDQEKKVGSVYGDDAAYIRFDVDADGTEEIIITKDGRISEIYGYYKDELNQAFDVYGEEEITLYPGGMLKAEYPGEDDKTETVWYQYFAQWGDYLAVFEELGGEYYTFCAYDMDEENFTEVERSLEETGYYPVWLGEWFDMLTKEDYDKLVPEADPVKLLQAVSLSGMSVEDIPEEYTIEQNFVYVKAPDGYANIRTGPGTSYEIICSVPNDEALEEYRGAVTAENGKRWIKVAYLNFLPEGREKWITGWIAESQLDL